MIAKLERTRIITKPGHLGTYDFNYYFQLYREARLLHVSALILITELSEDFFFTSNSPKGA